MAPRPHGRGHERLPGRLWRGGALCAALRGSLRAVHCPTTSLDMDHHLYQNQGIRCARVAHVWR